MKYKLSQKTVDTLSPLRITDKDTFCFYIVQLRYWGWTLQDIAGAFSVSKSAVALWEKQGLEIDGLPVEKFFVLEKEIKPKEARMTSTGPKQEPVDFLQEDQVKVFKLAKEARAVSKNTPLSAPSRHSAVLLEKLLLDLNNQGISMARLAVAAGVSRRAIAQRIIKARNAEKQVSANN